MIIVIQGTTNLTKKLWALEAPALNTDNERDKNYNFIHKIIFQIVYLTLESNRESNYCFFFSSSQRFPGGIHSLNSTQNRVCETFFLR